MTFPKSTGEGPSPEKETDNPAAERLSREREEQRRWKLRPQFADVDWFDGLLRNEFASEEDLHVLQRDALIRLARLAVRRRWYYRESFDRAGFGPAGIQDPADLVRLPILSRRDVVDREAALLPDGGRAPWQEVVWESSSGSTGKPVRVLHSLQSILLTHIVHQRQLRWFRMDPMATFAWIRIPKDLRCADGRQLPPMETLRFPVWPRVGVYIDTGPFLAFSKSNSTEAKVEWLEAHRPAYLQAASAQLDQLALAFQERPPLPELRGLWAVGEPLTAGMRRRIEEVFRVPVHIAYGLDELGWIAAMCPEGRRYHVHPERAIVEIVDDAGQPCPPGKPGRLLVTLLNNPAMPLLRYDTGDMAEPVEGPCPCGRPFPTFGPVIRRRERLRLLPPGTMDRVSPLLEAMEDLRLPLSGNLREYRVHQCRDGSFELRLVTAGAMPPAFEAHVRRVWQSGGQAAPGGRLTELRIVCVDRLPQTRSGKFFQFTSDHMGAASDGDTDGQR